jgi:hypothetical protein
MKPARRDFILALGSSMVALPAVAAEQVFKPEQSESAFKALLLARNLAVESLRAPQIVDFMIAFYEHSQALGISTEPKSDMLLYQWGTYNWGKGEWFEFGMTRQFMRQVGEDADFSQLSLNARFAPAGELLALARGDRWCESRADLPKFEQFVKDSPAFRSVAFLKPAAVEASWSPV